MKIFKTKSKMKFDEIVIINWWVSKQRGLIEVNFQREVAQELLGDFDPLTSEGMKFVLGLFNNQNTVNRLVSLGSVISELLNIEFPRNYKRNKNLLIKWFEHWSNSNTLFQNNFYF